MLNSLGLGFVFTARDLASGAMGRVERSFRSLDEAVTGGEGRLETAFAGIGTGMALLVAGAAAVATSFALASASGKFSDTVAAVGAVSDASAEDLRELRAAVLEASISTQFSPTEATLGLRELAQAGFTARESITLLQPALDLAAGSLGELSPQEAAGLASQALKAFGLSSDRAGISVDQLLQSVNLFALNASELPLALGTASRGAQTLSQSLSETLLALGLVKNVIPGVERASTAVSVAMERLATPEAQKRLDGLRVAVTTANGQFRSFLDVLGDLAPALAGMSEKERSLFLLETFGREALGGINAIIGQITTGVRTSAGEIVQGAAAVAYLREQMENAGGTAAKFREQMLGTFAGQRKLLAGSLQTLAIQLGAPFEAVFAPIVSVFTSALHGVLRVLQLIPEPVKQALAGFFVFASSAVGVAGAVIAAKAALSLLSVGMAALGISLAPILSVLAAVTAAMGVMAAAGAALYLAYQRNFGRLRDVVDGALGRVSLAVRGLAQLFQDGVLSGAVLDELSRAENDGVLTFVARMWQLAYRLEAVWSGFKHGVVEALGFAGPIFGQLARSFQDVARAFGLAGGDIGAVVTGLPSDRFREFGLVVGRVAGGIMAVLATLVTAIASTVASVANAFSTIWSVATTVTQAIARALSWLSEKFSGALDAMSSVLPSWLEPLVAETAGVTTARVAAHQNAPSQPAASLPAAVEVGARADGLAGLERTFAGRQREAPIQVASTLMLDGEVVARSVHEANRAEAARSFSALPAF
jgi:TP901 family phage tail tape measure protein